MDKKFIAARRGAFGGWFGVIYHYVNDQERRTWASMTNRQTREAAVDDAVEYAEANEIEIESIDFGD